jgi:sugar phosphate isomerase/epimerase
MNKHSRRAFLQTSALGLAVAGTGPVLTACSSHVKEEEKKCEILFQLGIASYTFRKFSLEETLSMTSRLGIKNLAFKSFHLPLESTIEQIAEAVKKVQEAGLNLYGGGVIYMTTEQEVSNAFEYARNAGMKVIIGAPNHELLPQVEQKVKEYDIMLAIHNHGPGDDLYPTAASIIEKIGNMDPRMGICLDIGHTVRVGGDPVQDVESYFDRILDIHIKDESAATPEGNTIEIGRGIIDIPSFLKTLTGKGYSRMVSFEFEKDEDDPLPGLAESVGYVRGVLDTL